MKRHPDDAQEGKLSPEFAARLARLKPEHKLRAIVMIDACAAPEKPARRPTRAERQATLQAMRDAAAPALGEIDSILKRHDGKRLSEQVSAVGSIAIEATPAGIHDLTTSEYVKSILEDQPMASLSHR
ncbi:MAG: hypothetical protein ETSY1_15825 [Candidatus Entotheonella factor]|uniref:Uncharacterized protein n=1 Tax=Entotheonella factor TaxID=1429438 RepID=W4LP88_ENTF1|nr:hypothetical protein [Candidatus Entotheonella palauensis]ETW99226.1 MAG: hypothetical protein ETSY1_15825 [Candidatus Entotheonella factor]